MLTLCLDALPPEVLLVLRVHGHDVDLVVLVPLPRPFHLLLVVFVVHSIVVLLQEKAAVARILLLQVLPVSSLEQD